MDLVALFTFLCGLVSGVALTVGAGLAVAAHDPLFKQATDIRSENDRDRRES